MQNVKVGEIYDKSRVLRVDKKAGLFLEIPSPTPSPGFVSVCLISNILLPGLFLFSRGPILCFYLLAITEGFILLLLRSILIFGYCDCDL